MNSKKPTLEELEQKIKELEIKLDAFKKVEKKLSIEKQFSESVINSLPGIFYILDEKGKFYRWNENLEKVSEYSTEEVLKLSPFDVFEEADKKIAADKIEEVFLYGRSNAELEIVSKSGKKTPYYLTGARTSIDNVSYLVGMGIDISERMRAESAMRKSEERFRNLTETISDWIWEVDKESFYTYVSPKIIHILGYDPEEIIGKTPFDLMPPEEAKRVFKIFNNIVASQEPFHCLENVNLHKNGHPVVLETSGSPIFSADGEFLGYRGVDRDITNRKQTENALQESESKLSAMLSSIGDHMSMMDKNLNIIWANEIAEKIFGNDIIGRKCYEVYHKRTEPCEPYPCITLRAFQNGTIHEHDTQVIDKDGKKIFFHCTANVALRDNEENPTAVLEISRDITEKVRTRKALHKAKNELEHRVKERTRDLEIKTKNLEEINIAMKVLLKKRAEDKKDIEDNVLTNVKELIAPFLKKIKKTKLNDQQKTFLTIMESNLNEIISPFTRKMSLKYLNLTPTEIRIANLIRHGNPSKEIAELLNLSPRTVETHRKNIRRKIGLEGNRANLRSHLLSLQ
jgi:PAS domain S-box-containing protein